MGKPKLRFFQVHPSFSYSRSSSFGRSYLLATTGTSCFALGGGASWLSCPGLEPNCQPGLAVYVLASGCHWKLHSKEIRIMPFFVFCQIEYTNERPMISSWRKHTLCNLHGTCHIVGDGKHFLYLCQNHSKLAQIHLDQNNLSFR